MLLTHTTQRVSITLSWYWSLLQLGFGCNTTKFRNALVYSCSIANLIVIFMRSLLLQQQLLFSQRVFFLIKEHYFFKRNIHIYLPNQIRHK